MPATAPTLFRLFPLLALPAACAAPCDYGSGNALPVYNSRGLPLVAAALNDRRMPFLLDTGGTTTTLLPEGVRAMGLQTDYLRDSRMKGIGGETASRNALLARLRIGTHEVRNLTLPVAQHGLGDNQREVAGILGADYLRNFEVDLDMPGRRVVLHDQRHCVAGPPPWSTPYSAIPIKLRHNGWPVIEVRINDQVLSALLDTGAAGSFISLAAARELGAPATVLEGPAGGKAVGIGTEQRELRFWRGVALEVGDERLKSFTPGITVLSDDLPFKMVLGQDYIASRHLWISYETRRLYVRQPAGGRAGTAADATPVRR